MRDGHGGMMLTYLRPMLWTENLDETIGFYTTVLGFKCGERCDRLGWASLSKDGIGLMLVTANDETEYDKIGFTGSLYFNTDDVDRLWHEVRRKADICYAPESFEWGMREFGIYDNNGYLLQFGQEIARAEQAAGKTGVLAAV